MRLSSAKSLFWINMSVYHYIVCCFQIPLPSLHIFQLYFFHTWSNIHLSCSKLVTQNASQSWSPAFQHSNTHIQTSHLSDTVCIVFWLWCCAVTQQVRSRCVLNVAMDQRVLSFQQPEASRMARVWILDSGLGFYLHMVFHSCLPTVHTGPSPPTPPWLSHVKDCAECLHTTHHIGQCALHARNCSAQNYTKKGKPSPYTVSLDPTTACSGAVQTLWPQCDNELEQAPVISKRELHQVRAVCSKSIAGKTSKLVLMTCWVLFVTLDVAVYKSPIHTILDLCINCEVADIDFEFHSLESWIEHSKMYLHAHFTYVNIRSQFCMSISWNQASTRRHIMCTCPSWPPQSCYVIV